MSAAFAERYGPWALILGASEGIGAAFARELAARGLRLVLVARRPGPLEALAEELRARVEVRTVVLDAASPMLPERLAAIGGELEIGLAIYNAAWSPLGPFLSRPLADQLLAVDVNCRGPVVLAHVLGSRMVERGRGAVVILSSLTAGQGTSMIATYAASKAFDRVLAESLWEELRGRGVQVLGVVPGATATPGYLGSLPSGRKAPARVMQPEAVVRQALASLGRPSVVTGWDNWLAMAVMERLLPRRLAVALMARATRALYDPARLPGPQQEPPDGA